MHAFLLEKAGETHKIQLEVSAYRNGGGLAILMKEPYSMDGPLWGVMTANLPLTCPRDCAFVDTNKNGESITDWIIHNGIGVPTGRKARSGYCEYPEFHFYAKVLKKLDPEGYQDYSSKLIDRFLQTCDESRPMTDTCKSGFLVWHGKLLSQAEADVNELFQALMAGGD